MTDREKIAYIHGFMSATKMGDTCMCTEHLLKFLSQALSLPVNAEWGEIVLEIDHQLEAWTGLEELPN
jgi:hypothetical protein